LEENQKKKPKTQPTLPNKPGVYLFKDRYSAVLYVGKAKNLKKRVASYFSKTPDIKTSVLLDKTRQIDFIVTDSEIKALILENELIKKYKPRYNISLRDDKTYPYLKLTVNEEFPRLLITRKKIKDKALYFGRFPSGIAGEILRLAKKIFPIRWCKEAPLRKREQPCLYYRIGACQGPCVGQITKQEYARVVQGLSLFLKGNMGGAIENLEKEMQIASANQDYEKAAALRDRIKRLLKLREGKEFKPRTIAETIELKKVLGLKKDPMRIEAFDISNIQGSNIAASMVVFFGGLPLKKDYRKFKIKSVKGRPDDAASMAEVVARRFGHKEKLPDLILIDGGKPQLSSALKALKNCGLDLPVIALAKKQEEIFTAKSKVSLKLDPSSSALKLLQRIRDEAHRFAVAYHRLRRKKANLV